MFAKQRKLLYTIVIVIFAATGLLTGRAELFGLVLILVVGTIILAGLSGGLHYNNILNQQRTYPNQGIWQSVKYGIFSLTLQILAIIILNKLLETSAFRTLVGAIFGLAFVLVLSMGLGTTIKHFFLRCVLTSVGNIPWNYARFLDYAAERVFLRKVGGGYIFVHRLLLEYFAGLEDEKPVT